MKISEELKKSAKWTIISSIVVQVLNITKMIVLARILTPDIFGEASIVLGVLTLTTLICQFGITQAVIASKSSNDYYISTMINVSILIGVIFFIILNIGAIYISEYYQFTEIKKQINILSIGIIISQLELVPNGFFQKELNYKTIVNVNIIKSITLCSTSIVLALNSFGVYSILVPPIIASLIAIVIYYKKMNKKLYFRINYQDIKIGYKYNISGLISGISNYICNNGMILIMGRYFSVNFLGQFSLAQKIADVETYILTAPVHNFLLPILNKIKEENKKLVFVSLEISRLQCTFLLPIVITLFINAENFILILFGENWIMTSDIFKFFLLTQIIRFSMIPVNSIIYAAGFPEKSTIISIIRLAIFIAGFLFIIYFRLFDLISVVIILLLDLFIYLLYMRAGLNILNIKLMEYYKYIKKPFIVNLLILIFFIFFMEVILFKTDGILFIEIFLPVVIYFFVFVLFFKSDIRLLFKFISLR